MGKSYGPQLSFIYSSKCSKGGKCDGAGRLLLLLPVLPGDRQCHASRRSCHTLGGISGTSPPPLAPTSNPALALLLLTPKSIPICLLHCQSFPEFPLFPLCCSHLQTGRLLFPPSVAWEIILSANQILLISFSYHQPPPPPNFFSSGFQLSLLCNP